MNTRLIASVMFAGFCMIASGCSDSSTTPSNTTPTFTAALSPANEVPPIGNADQTGSGTATIKLNTTKDSAGNITSATADFTVSLTGFPAGTTLTGAHIHQAAAGTNGNIVISTGIVTGEITLPNGSTTFTKTGVAVSDPAVAQGMLNAPANYYFNVHTALNPGGAARNQLTKIQ